MSSLVFTIIAACLVIVVAVGAIAISWLLTGRSRLRLGACGRDPKKLREEEEGCGKNISCSLCHPNSTEEKCKDKEQ